MKIHCSCITVVTGHDSNKCHTKLISVFVNDLKALSILECEPHTCDNHTRLGLPQHVTTKGASTNLFQHNNATVHKASL